MHNLLKEELVNLIDRKNYVEIYKILREELGLTKENVDSLIPIFEHFSENRSEEASDLIEQAYADGCEEMAECILDNAMAYPNYSKREKENWLNHDLGQAKEYFPNDENFEMYKQGWEDGFTTLEENANFDVEDESNYNVSNMYKDWRKRNGL